MLLGRHAGDYDHTVADEADPEGMQEVTAEQQCRRVVVVLDEDVAIVDSQRDEFARQRPLS